jgi:hypothetical protein
MGVSRPVIGGQSTTGKAAPLLRGQATRNNRMTPGKSHRNTNNWTDWPNSIYSLGETEGQVGSYTCTCCRSMLLIGMVVVMNVLWPWLW